MPAPCSAGVSGVRRCGRLPYPCRVTGPQTGQGQDHSRESVDMLTAARRLGISPDAVRKRIARGQLPGVQRGKRWYALLPPGPDTDTPDGQIGQDTDRTRPPDQTGPGQDRNQPDRTEELLDQLRGEVSFLREENRRKDAIIAALVEGQRRLTGPDRTAGQDMDRTVHNAPTAHGEAILRASPSFRDVLVMVRRWLKTPRR